MGEVQDGSGGGARALWVAVIVTLAAVVLWGVGWVIFYLLMLWLTPG